jgi:hypothetical protein
VTVVTRGPADAGMALDPVSLEIMWSRLISIADEMWTTVLRTAVSTIIGADLAAAAHNRGAPRTPIVRCPSSTWSCPGYSQDDRIFQWNRCSPAMRSRRMIHGSAPVTWMTSVVLGIPPRQGVRLPTRWPHASIGALDGMRA